MQPVPVPPIKKGDDARAALRLTRSALGEANARIVEGGRWYENVRQTYKYPQKVAR